MTRLVTPLVQKATPVDPGTVSAAPDRGSDVKLPENQSGVLDTSPRQLIELLVSDGYHPARVAAVAGIPIRLVFKRLDSDPCLDRVVFSAPHIERRLAPGSTTIVDLPAQRGGEIRFTCAMGRYRGRIEVAADARSSGAVARQVLRADSPTLLLMALSVVLALAFTAGGPGPGAALAAALLASLLVIGLAARLYRHWRRAPHP